MENARTQTTNAKSPIAPLISRKYAELIEAIESLAVDHPEFAPDAAKLAESRRHLDRKLDPIERAEVCVTLFTIEQIATIIGRDRRHLHRLRKQRKITPIDVRDGVALYSLESVKTILSGVRGNKSAMLQSLRKWSGLTDDSDAQALQD